MRVILWLTLGFAAACGFCAKFWMHQWLIPLALGLMLLGLAVVWLPKLRRFAAILLGCSLGLGWFCVYHSVYLKPVIPLHDQIVTLHATTSDFGFSTNYGTGVDGTIQVSGKTYSIRLYLDDLPALFPGDELEGDFRIALTTPDAQGRSAYGSVDGAFLVGYQEGNVVRIPTREAQGLENASVLRAAIREILRYIFPGDVFPFAQALLLGDTGELTYEMNTALKISGIRHIVAVSGLHVAVLYGFLRKLLLKNRYLTAILGLPLLAVFAAVAGFTPSVCRASIMVGLTISAQCINREYDSPTALSTATLIMLIFNPMLILSASLQLSVGCVAGILLFSEPIRAWVLSRFGKLKHKTWKQRFAHWFSSSVSVTLGAMSLTTPLSAWYFGAVSLIGPLTNLLVLWAVSFLFIGIILCCLVSLWKLSLGVFLGSLLSWPIRAVLWVATALSKVPVAAVYTRSIYIVVWLVFVYGMLAVLLVMRRRKPGLLIACATLGLCLALLASWYEPMTDNCRVTVLDVGQGQCILLQSGGRTYLVDCGGDSDAHAADAAAETLLSQGIRHLDGIIITHMDRDHSGGIPYLLSRVKADAIFLPVTATAEELAMVEEWTDGQVIAVETDLELRYDGVNMQIFAPVFVNDSNENSLCVLFSAENCDILITGDRSAFGERHLLRHRQLPDVELLIAGHHGAEDSTCVELLEAVCPETVIISVGRANRYGFPKEELLQRLAAFGCEIYRTDENGTITYRR